MAFDLCVIPVSTAPYLSALQTRQFSMTDITAHLVSEKLTREQCRSMTPDTFASSYGSSSHALHVRSSVSSEINLAITSSVSGNAPSGYTIVIQGYLNDRNSKIVLGVCVSDEPIVADASLRMFVNIEETNNVFRLRADFDGMVTQGLLDDILYQSLEAYPTIASYNSSTKKITFKNASNTELPNMAIDASAFIKDGMVNDDNYSKTFAGVWDGSSVDSDNYKLSHVDTSLSDQSDNVLVGLSKNSSKLVPLLVDDACHGAVTINPNLDWDSPVYALFAGYRCFSAHPMVDFRQILKYYNDSFMFTFSPMGSEAPSVADGDDGNKYFGSANYPVFISDFNGSYAGYKSFCVGTPSDVNIPSSDLHWRLLGYTTSKPGYIRLTESHPFLKDFIHQTGGYVKLSDFTTTIKDNSTGEVFTPSQYVKHIQETNPAYNLNTAVQELVDRYGESVFHIKDLNASSVSASESNGEVYVGLPHMTTVEFKNRVSFRTSTDEVAYIDRDGVYHGYAKGISSAPSLSFSPATSGTTGGTLSVSVGDKTSSSVAISPVRCAYEATTLATSRTVDGMLFNGSGNITHYGTCGSSSDTVAKVVTLAGFELATGARISVKFTYSNTATNPTLNVNGTGAKSICYRGTSAVSGTSDYYRWQNNDVVEFIYDGTNWVMVGWQTYAYHAESATSATSATSSTYATYLSCSTTKLLTASNTSTVTSSATIIPSSNGVYSLGSYNYKWDHVYANSVGTQYYPVSTAYIENMYGTASNATSDASGNTITSTYLKSVTLVNSSGTDLTSSGRVGVNETGNYVVPNKWPVLLRLTKGSDTTTDIGLRSLLCSYLMGISNDNTSTSSSSSLEHV